MLIGSFGINMTTIISKTAKQTEALGKKLAGVLKGGEVIALQGNLGTGKTTFVKGLAHALKFKQTITSPTFVLFKVYNNNNKKINQLVHVDCYRVGGLEIKKAGLDDYLYDPHTVVIIEWSDKIKLPQKNLINLKFKHLLQPNRREISW